MKISYYQKSHSTLPDFEGTKEISDPTICPFCKTHIVWDEDYTSYCICCHTLLEEIER